MPTVTQIFYAAHKWVTLKKVNIWNDIACKIVTFKTTIAVMRTVQRQPLSKDIPPPKKNEITVFFNRVTDSYGWKDVQVTIKHRRSDVKDIEQE